METQELEEKDIRLNEMYLCEQGKYDFHPYGCDPLTCQFVQEHILIELIKLNFQLRVGGEG